MSIENINIDNSKDRTLQEISEALVLDGALVDKIKKVLMCEESSEEFSVLSVDAKPFHWEYEHEKDDTLIHAKALEHTGGARTLYDVLLRNETTRQGYVIREQFIEDVLKIRDRFTDNRNVHL